MTATTQNNRHSAYATTSAIREVGTLAGTFIGGLLPGWFAALSHTSTDSPGPYQGALWIGALLGALSLIPLSRLKQDNVVVTTKVEATRAAFPFLPIALMVLYIYIRHMGWATCQAFCNPYMDVDLKLSAANIGLITSTGQIVAIIASLAVSGLLTRKGPGWVLVATSTGLGVSLLMLAVIPHWVGAGLGKLGILVFTAMWLPAVQVFQMETVDSTWQSVAYGAVSTAMGFGFGIASIFGGYMIASQGYRSLFMAGTLAIAVSMVFLTILLRRHRKSTI